MQPALTPAERPERRAVAAAANLAADIEQSVRQGAEFACATVHGTRRFTRHHPLTALGLAALLFYLIGTGNRRRA